MGWRALARQVEDLGYSTLTVADHFDDGLAPIPALMAAADATTSLRVGTMVLANDYRHPVVLAKEAATLDVLSGGRFELGLGAGWMATDDRTGVIEELAPAFHLTPAEAAATPHAMVGTVTQIAEQLLAQRERWGISYLGVSGDQLHALAPLVAQLAGT